MNMIQRDRRTWLKATGACSTASEVFKSIATATVVVLLDNRLVNGTLKKHWWPMILRSTDRGRTLDLWSEIPYAPERQPRPAGVFRLQSAQRRGQTLQRDSSAGSKSEEPKCELTVS